MGIPESASGVHPGKAPIVPEGDAFILNPFVGQEFLTREQAIDLINHISGALLIHERTGRHQTGIAKNSDDLRTS